MIKRLMGGFLLVSILMIAPAPVFSSGYMVREHSVAAIGNAFSGVTTGVHDLADIFYNPAALMRGSGQEASLQVSGLFIQSTYRHSSAVNALGAAMSGHAAGSDIAPQANIPSFYAAFDLKGKSRLGIAVNAPWGLKSQNPGGWVGRYHALDSDMTTMNITPMIARRLDAKNSLALGIQLQKIESTLSNAIDFGLIGASAKIPGAVPGTQDGLGTMSGEDWGKGFVVGFLHQPDSRQAFGFSYRSRVNHSLSGTMEFTPDTAGIAKTLTAATKAFQNTGNSADMTTPQVFSLGYERGLSDRWTLLADVTRTGWSEFRDLRITFENPSQADVVTQEHWHDTWFGSLGFLYRPDSRWTWRFGLARDEGPVDDEYRTPRVPTTGSRWIAVGVSYKTCSDSSIDIGFSHLLFDHAPIRLYASAPDHVVRGTLIGEYDTTMNLLGISFRKNF